MMSAMVATTQAPHSAHHARPAQRATPPTIHREAPRMTMRNGNLMPRARAERMDQDEEAQQQAHDAEEEANLERARQESM